MGPDPLPLLADPATRGQEPEVDLPSMPLGEHVVRLADRDSALLLWTTMPHLPDAWRLVEAWGFAYKTVGFTWAKRTPSGDGWHMGPGYWTRSNTEPCLLATKGSPPRLAADVSQLVIAPVGRHSAKPAEVHDRIERLVAGPYLELFARRVRPGWTAWGNEIEGHVAGGAS